MKIQLVRKLCSAPISNLGSGYGRRPSRSSYANTCAVKKSRRVAFGHAAAGLRHSRGPVGSGHSRKPFAAFTLIEIMVVMIILGVLAALIIPQFMGTTDDAKISKAKADVSELENAVERFNLNMDRRPTSEEGLKVLIEAPADGENKWRGPYISVLRQDPWGNPYQFKNPGTHHPSGVDIWSRGSDGADGGEGTAADIGNWQ